MRNAVALAGVYLERNGARILPPGTLAILTLVAANSEVAQKDQIIGFIRSVLAQNGA
jgi:hypothetical protein